MKINKKILIATCGLGLVAITATPFLVSCSQGASINLNQYDFTVNGSDKYRLTSSNVEKYDEANKKWINYNFNPSGNYSAEEIAKPEFIANQKEAVKQNIYFQVSTYLFNIMNSYLNFLTRVPKSGNVVDGNKNITDLTYNAITREFELAYGLGTGEGKDTYRLKINAINFNVDENTIWPSNNDFAYDKPISDIQAKHIVEVSNINVTLKYYKISSNTSYEYVNLKDVQNSNYKSYWKNYKFNGVEVKPTKEQFTIAISNKLFFQIKQGYKEVKNGEQKEYKSTGTITIDGIDNKNVGDYFNWPFAFSTSTISSNDINTKIEDQKKINNKIKDALYWANEDYNEFNKWIKNKDNEAAKIFPSSIITIS